MQSIITVNQTNTQQQQQQQQRDNRITRTDNNNNNNNNIDNNNNNVVEEEELEDISTSLAADGLIRLREHSPEDSNVQDNEEHRLKESVRFAQESLHSYRFSSSTSATTRTDLAEIRKSLMNRSIDFMKYKNNNTTYKMAPDTVPAHFHLSSIYNNPHHPHHPHYDDSHHDVLGRSKTKSVGYSPVTSFFNVEHYRASRRRQQSNPMLEIQESKTSRPASPITPDDVDLVTERLKRMDSGNNEHHSLSSSSSPPPHTSTHNTNMSSSSSSYSSCTTTTTTSSSSSCTADDNSTAPTSTSNSPSSNHTNNKRPGIQRQASSSTNIFPHPALHNTSRFLPQNQAILTTYDDWRVILSNDIAALVLVGMGGSCRGLVGKSVVDFIEPSYRDRFLDMVTKRREELSHLEDSTGGMVLVCGNVLPIIKQDGSRSAASLWLKEKRNDAGSPVYIWIFEEVFETVTHITVDMQGIIQYTDDSVHELYGYESGELIGKSVDILIPSLQEIQDISRLRFFGSRTKLGAHFPIVAKLHTVASSSPHRPECFTLRITSIPMIAGLVTIRKDGTIEGCNTVFSGYMFGLSQEELVATDIADLMPQIPILLDSLQRDDLLQHGFIINSLICRQLIAGDHGHEQHTHLLPPPSQQNGNGRRLTQAPNGQILPVLLAIHRDKTPFEIQLQLKLVEGSDDVCALWITFDREATFSRVGHTSLTNSPPLEIKQHDGLGLPAAKRPPSSEKSDEDDVDHNVSITTTTDPSPSAPSPSSPQPTMTIKTKDEQEEEEKPKPSYQQVSTPQPITTTTTMAEERPSRIITSFSRPTYFSSSGANGATYNNSNVVPSSPISPCTPRSSSSRLSSRPPSTQQTSLLPDYSAQTNAICIDDYTILDNLGQGAYGLVKLAVKKDDPEQKKVVIKYVIKSRILVDCWTKDRKLGVIPVEIHILHTLRKIPHKNCSDMLDYFEDEDHYYIVMGLHGIGMDLFDYIELKNGMMDDEIKDIFKQIAQAVRHLHENKIVHRDIKDENVVLDQNGGVRLIDFGSAAYLKGRRYDTFVGTLDYAAPEILAGQTYEGPAQDIWALGILLYTLVYRENPFYDIDEILSHELRVPFVLSDGSLDLIKQMLDRNVDQRPDIHAVLAHSWLN
ncbi:hypothetical protein BDA99DRAFT_564106 [Phascolomyces articulosus]|uniref:non-specific serine/threonine protein kinase n=1 Tax=Phascolomyces articulosus TaxID=60185 RepID=A0AAD5JQQ8_9FUNG|nr:hypothetical protein BDA99DRAFT_564106 [Phascolomyces articulosus]